MGKTFQALLVVYACTSCGPRGGQEVSRLTEEFVYTSLSFSPVAATSVGLHEYQGRRLDEAMDDLSAAGIERQRRYYRQFRDRLSRIRREDLDPQEAVDYAILNDQTALQLLELDEIRAFQHNPTLYVELIGNALFSPWVLEYAPKAERMGHIIARLKQVPLLTDQARINLISSPEIWARVAIEENEGNLRLIDRTIREGVPCDQRAEYDRAAEGALAALRKLQEHLKTTMSGRTRHDWRLGADHYARKFRYVLATGQEVPVVLQQAEADLAAVRARMAERAAPLHARLYPGHGAHAGMVEEVLAAIADRHSSPQSYLADARRDLGEARQFVRDRGLLTLPPRDNLSVIETPEFMRGIYAVGGFQPAPALEAQLGAFYWITPIPPAWPKPRAESKLREYNFYKLKLLTIHEAMPGHYVQFEYANDIQPRPRRLLRAVFGNGPYVEGWAQYATEAMLDAGYLDHSPELRLTYEKEELRMLANAILDIRLHTLNMSDQEALDLMQKQTYQEAEEATAKLQRAKLSSAQLPTYYVGWRAWKWLRERFRDMPLKEFNDRALKAGAVPVAALEHLLQ